MFVTIINDCRDDNAAGRQGTRIASLLGIAPTFIGVESDLEAAGNLIDALDAGEGREGTVLANVAPRSGEGKKWANGTPFGYFKYKNTHVFATIDGLTCSLVKKLAIADKIKVIDIQASAEALKSVSAISESEAHYILNTQFRSLDFLPRIAAQTLEGSELQGNFLDISELAGPPDAIWWVDNFGNAKTTMLREDVKIKDSGLIETSFGNLQWHDRLKDVPEGECAIIEGSSGLPGKRFVEIVAQNVHGSARVKLGVKSGDSIF
jgi:hypothetical protein